MKHKCIDCIHCDVEHLKCRPGTKDCKVEYELSETDLITYDRCDFFFPKEDEEEIE